MKHLSVFGWSKPGASLQVATQSLAEGRRKCWAFSKCLQSDAREKMQMFYLADVRTSKGL